MHPNPLSYFSCKVCQEHIFSSSDPEQFDPQPNPLIDQKMELLAPFLFACLFATTTYCVYRYCFKAKEIVIEFDPTQMRTHHIGSTQLNTAFPSSLENPAQENFQIVAPCFDQLIHSAQKVSPFFPRLSCTDSTAIKQIKKLYNNEVILHAFQNTRVLIHPSINTLISGFLQ